MAGITPVITHVPRPVTQHYSDSKAWLESEFADDTIPVRPTIDKHFWTLLPPKAGLYKADYTNLHDLINQLAETEHLSMDGFFSLCATLAIAEYCGTDAAALTWAYEGRERPEEQRVFGSLHRDVPFRISKCDAATKEEMVWGFRVAFVTYGSKGFTDEQYDALLFPGSLPSGFSPEHIP